MQIPVIGLDRIVFAGGTRQFDLFIISQSGASIVMVNLTAPMIARSGAKVPAVPSALDNGRRSRKLLRAGVTDLLGRKPRTSSIDDR
jgi:hypothetical protein